MSRGKEDCFAYSAMLGRPECNALKEMQCLNGDCKFYKNRRDVDYMQIEEDIKEYSKKVNTKGESN